MLITITTPTKSCTCTRLCNNMSWNAAHCCRGIAVGYRRIGSRGLPVRSITGALINAALSRCHQELLKPSQSLLYPQTITSVPLSVVVKLHTKVPWLTADTPSDEDDVKIPEPPTTCCMSGCANCVWVEYAQELAELYKDGGRAAEKVMKAIEDPSLKIFLSLELKDKLKHSEEGN